MDILCSSKQVRIWTKECKSNIFTRDSKIKKDLKEREEIEEIYEEYEETICKRKKLEEQIIDVSKNLETDNEN